jgi:biopolymer transport protein TolR
MAMHTGGKAGPSASMNVTPLIDVLLVLIIIFMVLPTPKLTGEEALIPHPPDKPQPEAPVHTLVVQLLASTGSRPELKINGESVSWLGLRPRLQEILKTRAERVLFVRADSDLDYEYVAQIIGIARSAGADHVGLMTARLESR